MSCSQFDVNAYFFGELAEPERRQLEEHFRGCQDCREDLERLRVTRTALLALPDEEPPRRIAFVSDRIFEHRGWRRFWDSAPRLGFASAAMLSVAILVHAFTRPAPMTAPQAMNVAALEARVEAEAGKQFQAVLERTLAESRERQRQQTAELVAAMEGRMEQQRRSDLLMVEERLKYLQKKLSIFYTASNDVGGLP